MIEVFTEEEKSLVKGAKMLLDMYYSMALSVPVSDSENGISLNQIARFCVENNGFISGGAFSTIIRDLNTILKYPQIASTGVFITTPNDIDIWFGDSSVELQIIQRQYFIPMNRYLEIATGNDQDATSAGSYNKGIIVDNYLRYVTTNACTYNFNQENKHHSINSMLNTKLDAIEKKLNDPGFYDITKPVLSALHIYVARLIRNNKDDLDILPKIQLIYNDSGTPEYITSKFDFEHVKPYFILEDKLLYVSKDQLDLILSGTLRLSENAKYQPDVLSKRVEKYQKRGFKNICPNINNIFVKNTLPVAA